jgi:hypothetical protein
LSARTLYVREGGSMGLAVGLQAITVH